MNSYFSLIIRLVKKSFSVWQQFKPTVKWKTWPLVLLHMKIWSPQAFHFQRWVWCLDTRLWSSISSRVDRVTKSWDGDQQTEQVRASEAGHCHSWSSNTQQSNDRWAADVKAQRLRWPRPAELKESIWLGCIVWIIQNTLLSRTQRDGWSDSRSILASKVSLSEVRSGPPPPPSTPLHPLCGEISLHR